MANCTARSIEEVRQTSDSIAIGTLAELPCVLFDNSTEHLTCEGLLDAYRGAQEDRAAPLSFTDKAMIVILERICGTEANGNG